MKIKKLHPEVYRQKLVLNELERLELECRQRGEPWTLQELREQYLVTQAKVNSPISKLKNLIYNILQ
jgi:hypothetical protein